MSGFDQAYAITTMFVRCVMFFSLALCLLATIAGCAYQNRGNITSIDQINGFAYIATGSKAVNKYDIDNDRFSRVKIVDGYKVNHIFHNNKYIVYFAYKKGICSLLIYDLNDNYISQVNFIFRQDIGHVAADDKYFYFFNYITKDSEGEKYYKNQD